METVMPGIGCFSIHRAVLTASSGQSLSSLLCASAIAFWDGGPVTRVDARKSIGVDVVLSYVSYVCHGLCYEIEVVELPL
jgi:hypothetical protein